MTDREMLEWAAKSIGDHAEEYDEKRGVWLANARVWWNPRDDDGDAFRLAVRLKLSVGPTHGGTVVQWQLCPDDFEDGHVPIWPAEISSGDPCAATRLAIVRAAAEIGRAMK